MNTGIPSIDNTLAPSGAKDGEILLIYVSEGMQKTLARRIKKTYPGAMLIDLNQGLQRKGLMTLHKSVRVHQNVVVVGNLQATGAIESRLKWCAYLPHLHTALKESGAVCIMFGTKPNETALALRHYAHTILTLGVDEEGHDTLVITKRRHERH